MSEQIPLEDLRLPLGSITSTWTHDGGLQAPMFLPMEQTLGRAVQPWELVVGK